MQYNKENILFWEGGNKYLKKENVPEKNHSKQLILRYILMRLQNLRKIKK